MKMNQDKYTIMTEMKVSKLINRLAVPTILSMLVTSFYNMADTFFVGRISTSASAAVGVAYSLMAIIQAVGFMFGHGSGNYISRKLGSQNVDDASKMLVIGFVSALFTGACITIFGLLFLDILVLVLGATETIFPYAKAYIQIILLGAPYMCASLVLNNQLRFQGSARYAMTGIVSGAMINIILDPLFIFVLNMGIGGAALATVISQFISFCILCYGTHKGGNLRIDFRKFSFDPEYYKNILKGGFPSLTRQGISAISTIILNIAAGGYGDAAIAGISIVTRISNFAASIMIGFGQGFQPVCGFNYGAEKFDRVKQGFWYCTKISLVILIILSVVGYLNAESIISVFRKGDVDVLAIGSQTLRLHCITFWMIGWVTITNMMLQTIGRTMSASILAASRSGLFLIPALIIGNYVFGLLGVELAQVIADICSFILAVPLCLKVLGNMKNR